MNIQNKTVLVLGGWGLVGSAVCRRLMKDKPKRIIVTSLNKNEAFDAVKQLQKEYPKVGKKYFIPWWGNVFHQFKFKDISREEILSDQKKRNQFMDDFLNEMTPAMVKDSSINNLLEKYKPHIVIDCINTATAIAYQDIFQSAREVRQKLKSSSQADLKNVVENLLSTLYVPQLIRHVQLFYRSMSLNKTEIYVKIGTSGTGGMGLNIPYTHSEEKPSRVLLSKSAVAGAHTLLLFLMGRTPDAPITKEIKPTGAIAWKKISFGEIKKRGMPIDLYDCKIEDAIELKNKLKLNYNLSKKTKDTLKAVFIDTGENGIFSRGEFEAISTPGQMEYVTPEEIANDVVFEILGGNTGHDIINALDNATLEPTYRAGFMFLSAIEKLKSLEKESLTDSIAFEMLGPPRLSKLLYEAFLLKKVFGSMKEVVKFSAKEISKRIEEFISNNSELRSKIISIGIPILLSDGKRILRANLMKIPPNRGENEIKISSKSIDLWADAGWVDLRIKNFDKWRKRFIQLMAIVNSQPIDDTSSRYFNTKEHWDNFNSINEGKLVGWIFIEEEHGIRMK